MLHPYHCVLCGTQLREIGMGIIECPKCGEQFLPSSNAEETEYSLSWCPEPKAAKHDLYRDTVLHALAIADGACEDLRAPREVHSRSLEAMAMKLYATDESFRKKLEVCRHDSSAESPAPEQARDWLRAEMGRWIQGHHYESNTTKDQAV